MEKNIESILLEAGIDFRLCGNIKKTFRNVTYYTTRQRWRSLLLLF